MLSTTEEAMIWLDAARPLCYSLSRKILLSLTSRRAARISYPGEVCPFLLLHLSQASLSRLEAVREDIVNTRYTSFGVRWHRWLRRQKVWRLYPTTRGMPCVVWCNEGAQNPLGSKSAWLPISVKSVETQAHRLIRVRDDHTLAQVPVQGL